MNWLKNLLPPEWRHWVLWIVCLIVLITLIVRLGWRLYWRSKKEAGKNESENIESTLEKANNALEKAKEVFQRLLNASETVTDASNSWTALQKSWAALQKAEETKAAAQRDADEKKAEANRLAAEAAEIKEPAVKKAKNELADAAFADAVTAAVKADAANKDCDSAQTAFDKYKDKYKKDFKSHENQLNEIKAACGDALKDSDLSADIVNAHRRQLIHLRIQMERTNFWFHLVRNNPRHREQYYFALIAIVGYENWKNVDDTIRMNWESARLSFDRMYGMVKDFAKSPEKYAVLFHVNASKPQTTDAANPAEILDKLNEKNDLLSTKLDKLSGKFDDLKKILPPQDKVKEVRDALNEWIPPDDKADKK